MPVAKLAIREADPGWAPIRRRGRDRATLLRQCLIWGGGLHAGGSGVCGLSLDRRVCRPADGDPGVAAAQGTEEGAAGSLWGAFLADRRAGSGAAADAAVQGSAGRDDGIAGDRMAGGRRGPWRRRWRSRQWQWTGVGWQVRHGFTHFELVIDVLASQVPVIEAEGFAQPLDALEAAALPSVMWKYVRMAGSGRV